MPLRVAFFALMLVAVFASVTYMGGLRATARGETTPGDRLKAKVWNPPLKGRLKAAASPPVKKRPATEDPERTEPPPAVHLRQPPPPDGDQGRLFGE